MSEHRAVTWYENVAAELEAREYPTQAPTLGHFESMADYYAASVAAEARKPIHKVVAGSAHALIIGSAGKHVKLDRDVKSLMKRAWKFLVKDIKQAWNELATFQETCINTLADQAEQETRGEQNGYGRHRLLV